MQGPSTPTAVESYAQRLLWRHFGLGSVTCELQQVNESDRENSDGEDGVWSFSALFLLNWIRASVLIDNSQQAGFRLGSYSFKAESCFFLGEGMHERSFVAGLAPSTPPLYYDSHHPCYDTGHARVYPP